MEEIDTLEIFAAYKNSRPISLEYDSYELGIEEGEIIDLTCLPELSHNLDKCKKV